MTSAAANNSSSRPNSLHSADAQVLNTSPGKIAFIATVDTGRLANHWIIALHIGGPLLEIREPDIAPAPTED